MSQYPPTPSFAGPSNYAQQWTAHRPHNSGSRPGSELYAMNNPMPMAAGNFATIPFNANPPTQLPGLGMPSGSMQSPYSSHQFSENSVTAPFSSGMNGPGVLTPDASLSNTTYGLPQPLMTLQPLTSQLLTNSFNDSLPRARDESDREEGEVSDGSGNEPTTLQTQSSTRPFSSSRFHAAGPPSPNQRDLRREMHSTQVQTLPPTQKVSQYESTGLSSSNDNQSQREGSESPYNPPMTIAVDSVPDVSHGVPHKSSETRAQHESTESQFNESSYIAGKTIAQIRVMAQGALLGLAPHNIRFNELVKENIDPNILRQLYDDIGIKIANTFSDSKSTDKPDTVASTINPEEPDNHPTDVTSPPKAQQGIVNNNNTTSLLTKEEDPSVPTPGKPLERKDVIARMLAAKAKKSTTPITKSKSAEPTPSPASDISRGASRATDIAESSKASVITQTKEKNKAQTELARQRIEQLKKMGIKRQQSQPESLPTTHKSSPQISSTQKPNTVLPSALPHPLPERPPVPDKPVTTPEISTLQIPGLSMPASQGMPSTIPAAVQNPALDIASSSRNTTAKRPRASDFDEPIPKPKKPLISENRLIIDISEDDLSEDDDAVMPDATDDTASSQTSNFPRSSALARQRSSASATPQSRLNDAESLRQKDLEIQAMRRRIAEFEEKKKAKQTTLDPMVSAVSGPGSFKLTDALDTAQSNTTNRPSEIPSASLTKSTLPDAPIDSSVQSPMSLDTPNLERMRQKLLRKQEIECGLPTLDDEISSIESKLAEFKRQEEELLAEIAKGREGRKQLVDELQNLIMETQGLTMEALEAAKEETHRAEAARVTGTQAPALEITKLVNSQSVNQALPTEQASSLVDVSSSDSRKNDSGMVESQSLSSEASDSSMDESTSSSGPSLAEQDSEPEPQVTTSLPTIEPANLQKDLATDFMPVENPEIVPPVPADPESMATVPGPSDELNVSQKSPMLSGNYEPPEPDDSVEEAYSPKLGLSGDDAEMDTNSVSPSSHSDADMELTPKFQEPVVIASKNDALDNPHRSSSTLKYSPYESPLKYFRAYRYHPRFPEEVSGSYRSLTYSHKIDPFQAFCPYETAGGVCNDTTCEFQHWRDMVMPDDKILVEMGNQREGKTPEEKDKFLEGLKEIINSMRRDQVQDLLTVANEIAAYRRRFLSDPSRILPL